MNCRVCGHDLDTILDLGNQCLGGQFPKIGEPDPPRFPLVLSRCVTCGLIQLRNTVDPRLMFTEYGYRSGVTETMRTHLHGIVAEATGLLGRVPRKALDIGSNDGTLLQFIGSEEKWAIDPSDVVPRCGATIDLTSSVRQTARMRYIKGFYPHPDLVGEKFHVIFSIACFYDVNDPVTFVRAVRDNLAPGGLWCCEVSDVNAVLGKPAWDSICHEHLCYFSAASFRNICAQAGLEIIQSKTNACNGGSLRFYARIDQRKHTHPWQDKTSCVPSDFAGRVQNSRAWIDFYLQGYRVQGKKVHLLGASTKANTVLQYCGVTTDYVQYASDRDPRKVGRCTPGSRIPIISEDESRAMRPDVYLVGPWHFKDEIVQREKAFLDGGGTLLFPLPTLTEVRA